MFWMSSHLTPLTLYILILLSLHKENIFFRRAPAKAHLDSAIGGPQAMNMRRFCMQG
jgi:hypothetical protein